MDNWLTHFVPDLVGRLHGPFSFRFVLQPLMALIYAARDGLADALLGELRVTRATRDDWDTTLREVARSLRRLARAHPRAFPLLATLGLDSDDVCGRCALDIDSFVAMAAECDSTGGTCAGCTAVCDRRHAASQARLDRRGQVCLPRDTGRQLRAGRSPARAPRGRARRAGRRHGLRGADAGLANRLNLFHPPLGCPHTLIRGRRMKKVH